jgi:hypothetical protein
MDLDQIKRLPLVACHAILARLESEIDKEARAIGGETLECWLGFGPNTDETRLYGVTSSKRWEFARVGEIVREKERAEIAALMAEAGRAA